MTSINQLALLSIAAVTLPASAQGVTHNAFIKHETRVTEATLMTEIEIPSIAASRQTMRGKVAAQLPLLAGDGTSIDGSGTEQDPYLIGSLADWTYLTRQVNNSSNTFAGKYIKLTADLDFSGFTITPLASFAGTLDGDGHTLSNVRITNRSNSGLVSVNNGTIRNIQVQNAYLTGDTNIGVMASKNYGTIEYCYVAQGVADIEDAGVVGTSFLGGIAGWNYGTIDHCYVTDSWTEGNFCCGAVAGISTGTVKDCAVFDGSYLYATSSTNPSGIGGIVGRATGGSISNCAFAGIIYGYDSGVNNYFGGIAGSAGDVVLEDNYAAGTIRGNRIVGGIAGYADGTTITRCESAMNVQSFVLSDSQTGIAGGLIGQSAAATVTACKTSNRQWNIYSNGSAYVRNTTGIVGGMVGVALNANTVVSECYTVAMPTGYKYAGGIVGQGGGIYNNVYSEATVITNAGYAGGLVGYASTDLTINGGYNVGYAYRGFETGVSMAPALVGGAASGAQVNVEAAYITDFGMTDTRGTAMTIRELAAAGSELAAVADDAVWLYGDAYTYPVLATNHDDLALATAAVVVPVNPTDTYDHITGDVYVGRPEGSTWTFSNDSLQIDATNPNLVRVISPMDSTATTMVITVGDYSSGWNVTFDVAEVEQPYATGDVNGDGEVDINDVNILINVVLGLDDADNYNGRALVTDDASVDIADVNEVINIILSSKPQDAN